MNKRRVNCRGIFFRVGWFSSQSAYLTRVNSAQENPLLRNLSKYKIPAVATPSDLLHGLYRSLYARCVAATDSFVLLAFCGGIQNCPWHPRSRQLEHKRPISVCPNCQGSCVTSPDPVSWPPTRLSSFSGVGFTAESGLVWILEVQRFSHKNESATVAKQCCQPLLLTIPRKVHLFRNYFSDPPHRRRIPSSHGGLQANLLETRG